MRPRWRAFKRLCRVTCRDLWCMGGMLTFIRLAWVGLLLGGCGLQPVAPAFDTPNYERSHGRP